MATEAFQTEHITLQDEDSTEVVVRPLPIARLREFMESWKKIAEIEDGDDGFDIFINCCGIALKNNFKGKFENLTASADEKKNGKVLSEEYEEYLRDCLDLETIYLILDIAGGIKLNDPKLLEAAAALTQE